ncbi:polysaccharide deacetylase family protein [Paraburkholderia acidiphila]|uniref:Polysaccharide deacetylase family protein n=1 Tax=Paraburkholderia acidiphila TaxID=2571747 RepID=A0A7Z2J947_9BURK|nr:polysaccharide deacetylase [Paraburkholderia acidiphila]QGZ56377.1 polysaccharide deacetylase family protein [Paraburkholderia acidiphila]
MPLKLPQGRKIAVNIGVDFDGQSVWMNSFGLTSPGYLSRGEFCAIVAAPRLLAELKRFDIKSTWFTPTHTMETFPAQFEAVLAHGHEVGAHGCVHEKVGGLSGEAERALMEKQLRLHERIVGKRPRGYRSPSWDLTENTLSILEDNGFDWDSSLMGRDFEPYRPSNVTLRDDGGNVFGPPSTKILEMPVSWHLDDFPAIEYVPRMNAGMAAPDVILGRWMDHFTYAYEEVPNAAVFYTLHPQSIGKAPYILMLRRLLERISSYGDVWFATMSEIHDCWVD